MPRAGGENRSGRGLSGYKDPQSTNLGPGCQGRGPRPSRTHPAPPGLVPSTGILGLRTPALWKSQPQRPCEEQGPGTAWAPSP